VALELLLVDLDAGDVDAAHQGRCLATRESGLIRGEAAAERGHAVVGDRKGD
jgi:hypothetical protein